MHIITTKQYNMYIRWQIQYTDLIHSIICLNGSTREIFSLQRYILNIAWTKYTAYSRGLHFCIIRISMHINFTLVLLSLANANPFTVSSNLSIHSSNQQSVYPCLARHIAVCQANCSHPSFGILMYPFTYHPPMNPSEHLSIHCSS